MMHRYQMENKAIP